MFNKKRKIVLAVILVAILALLFAKYYENNSIERDIKNKWATRLVWPRILNAIMPHSNNKTWRVIPRRSDQ
jgi:hypothetical protein